MDKVEIFQIIKRLQASIWWWFLGGIGLVTATVGSVLAYQTHFQHPRYSYIPADEEWHKYLKEIVQVSRASLEKPEATASSIWVDVAGAVEKPGVYQFSVESRVQDAVLAAGGFSKTADKTFIHRELNLALPLFNNNKIYIPSEGEKSFLVTPVDSEKSNSGVFYINLDDVSRIDELPGIGEVRAESIVNNRPYLNEVELQEKSGVSASIMDSWKEKGIQIEY